MTLTESLSIAALLKPKLERPSYQTVGNPWHTNDPALLRELRRQRAEGNVNIGVPNWARDRFPWAPSKALKEFDPKYENLLIMQDIKGHGGPRFPGQPCPAPRLDIGGET